MTTFLEQILQTKKREVEALYHKYGSQLNDAIHEGLRLNSLSPCRGFREHIKRQNTLSVIAEIKQASPSKGKIASNFQPGLQATVYEGAGASAISVLTDETYFQGSLADLKTVRGVVDIPILRKDFIIDEIQIAEARLAGADAILLICAALSQNRLVELARYANSLGLDVLIEVHGPEEVESAVMANATVIGINNRNLHTFEVELDTTRRVIPIIPVDYAVISESGIHQRQDAELVAGYGADAVLVGESLMRQGDTTEVSRKLASFRVPIKQRRGGEQTA